jgi:hypothetical protein
MPVFKLRLHQTYYRQGFFNVVVDFDRYVRKTEGSIRLRLGRDGQEIAAKVNRRVNRNGTARILGGIPLRDWFQRHFNPMDSVEVDFASQDVIVLAKS